VREYRLLPDQSAIASAIRRDLLRMLRRLSDASWPHASFLHQFLGIWQTLRKRIRSHRYTIGATMSRRDYMNPHLYHSKNRSICNVRIA
jgi:hypothetical protein